MTDKEQAEAVRLLRQVVKVTNAFGSHIASGAYISAGEALFNIKETLRNIKTFLEDLK